MIKKLFDKIISMSMPCWVLIPFKIYVGRKSKEVSIFYKVPIKETVRHFKV